MSRHQEDGKQICYYRWHLSASSWGNPIPNNETLARSGHGRCFAHVAAGRALFREGELANLGPEAAT
jgi:hypothetical protein